MMNNGKRSGWGASTEVELAKRGLGLVKESAQASQQFLQITPNPRPHARQTARERRRWAPRQG
jgi:hypothetical protein